MNIEINNNNIYFGLGTGLTSNSRVILFDCTKTQ
jgi:hypothetical protein